MPGLPPGSVDKLTLNGIEARIYWDGYRKRESLREGPSREILYLVDWDLSDNFIDSLMGLMRPIGGPTGTINFTYPHRYPKNEVIWCVEAEGNPVGVPRPDPKLYGSDFCLVRARYEVPRMGDVAGENQDITPDPAGGAAVPRGEWDIGAVGSEMPWANTALKYESDATVPTRDFPFQATEETIALTIHQLPAMYLEDIRPYRNSVNSDVFMGCAPGCALFNTYNISGTVYASGQLTVKLRLEWKARDVDWNAMQRLNDAGPAAPGAVTVGWDFVKGAASGQRVYPYLDHNALVQFFQSMGGVA